ncbi:MAG: hypothetical protein LC722_00695, partial [Actinobacteria bacterium]|nr:hypothetical protein [Actinomycetota bacterium]
MRRFLAIAAVLTLNACATPTAPPQFSKPGLVRLADGNEAVDRGTERVSGTVRVTMGEFYFE